MKISELKDIAVSAVEADCESIIKLSRYINNNPETAYGEVKAVKALTEFLAERGFVIHQRAGGLETAFTADFCTSGTEYVPVAIIAEYDALPGIGHGCAHNLIAAAAAAAAAGAAAAVRAGGGRGFRLIGTPAEETITEAAGKNRLIKAGIFKEVGSALMFHPWVKTGVAEKDLGCNSYHIIFKGRPAHAAADPWNGRNALDAAVIFYNSIGLLRQQLPSGFFIHCIITDGGSVLNVIPQRAEVEIILRSTELEDILSIEKRVEDCVSAAAAAAGCGFEMQPMAAVKPVLFNRGLFELAAANMKATGEDLEKLPLWQASSDFGDVSREIPSLSILYKTHNENTCWHSKDVAEEAVSESAHEAMLRAAKILAVTATDIIFGEDY